MLRDRVEGCGSDLGDVVEMVLTSMTSEMKRAFISSHSQLKTCWKETSAPLISKSASATQLLATKATSVPEHAVAKVMALTSFTFSQISVRGQLSEFANMSRMTSRRGSPPSWLRLPVPESTAAGAEAELAAASSKTAAWSGLLGLGLPLVGGGDSDTDNKTESSHDGCTKSANEVAATAADDDGAPASGAAGPPPPPPPPPPPGHTPRQRGARAPAPGDRLHLA